MKNYNLKRKTLLLSCAICALNISNAIADEIEENTKSNSSETVLVIGQKTAPITVVPRGLSVSLNKADFEAVNAINVEDLMKYTPNFFVRKRFAGDDNAVVALRGVNTTQSARVIVMVDGFLVSNFLGNTFSTSPKWNVVGPAEVKQFDIVYGPYSARYNGNSMGGIVSITTQEPKENSGYINALTNIMPFKEYGFDETFKGYNIEGGYNWKQNDGPLSARLSFRHFENIGQSQSYSLLAPTTGSGTNVTGAYANSNLTGPVFGAQSPPDVVQDQLRARVGLDLGANWHFDLLAMGWRTVQSLEDARIFIENADGTPYTGIGKVVFNGQTYSTSAITLSNFERDEYLIGAKLKGSLAGWDTRTNLSQYFIPKFDTWTSSNYETGKSNGRGTFKSADNPNWWALDSWAEKEIGRHKIAIGVNGNIYSTEENNYSTTAWRQASAPIFTSASGGKTSAFGVYAEDEIVFENGTLLTLGARYDKWRAYDGYLSSVVSNNRVDIHYNERDESSFSPKASIQAEIADGLMAQLSIGKATRFPTVGELFQAKFKSNSGEIDPKSFDPNLKPEVSTDLSFMLRKKFGNINVTASLFYQDIKDAIVSFTSAVPNEDGIYLSGYQNIDLMTQYGIELIGEGRNIIFEGLNADFSLTRMESTVVRNNADPNMEGITSPRIPDWRVSGNLRYALTPKIKANLGLRYASRPNSDLYGLRRGDDFSYQSEYLFIDTRVNWQVKDNVAFGFGIDNINNDQAYVHHPLPQRTFVFDIKYNF